MIIEELTRQDTDMLKFNTIYIHIGHIILVINKWHNEQLKITNVLNNTKEDTSSLTLLCKKPNNLLNNRK